MLLRSRLACIAPVLVLALLPASFVATAHAHPLHTTMTELTFDARTRSLRATIHAFSDDFGRAVNGLSPEATPPAQVSDSAAIAYLRGHLVVTGPDGRVIPLRWCGIERRGDAYLIGMEAAGTGRMDGVRIRNRLHTDLYPDQINIVQATDGRSRATLLFTGADWSKPLL